MESKRSNNRPKTNRSEAILTLTLNLPNLHSNRINTINMTNLWDLRLTIKIQQSNHLMKERVMSTTNTLNLIIEILTNTETIDHTVISIRKVSTTSTPVISITQTILLMLSLFNLKTFPGLE